MSSVFTFTTYARAILWLRCRRGWSGALEQQRAERAVASAELVALACGAPLAIVLASSGGEVRVDSTHGAFELGTEKAQAFLAELVARGEPLVVVNLDTAPDSAATLFARGTGASALAATVATDGSGRAVMVAVLDIVSRPFGVRECRILDAIAWQECARLATEKELATNAETLEAIFALSNLLLCVIGFDGSFERLNVVAWAEVLGYSEAEFKAEPFWALLHPDDVARTQIEFERLMSGQVTAAFENRYRARDGSYRWLLWSANAEPRTRRVFAAASDVTALKDNEDLRRAHAAQLQRSNADLQEFAQVASHDLQEPLRKITAFGDRLATVAGDALGEQGLDYLRRMRGAAERMSLLIESLLELSRVASGAPTFKEVDLDALVAGILTDLEERIALSKGTVVVGRLPVVQGDRAQLQRLFQNLIANALKFHAPDVPPVVRVDGEALAGGGVEVQVADEGVGFDEKYRARLFKPFQRLHTTREFTGTGMGLAISAKIAARHGGEITARSVLGSGSVFIVRLGSRSSEKGAVP